MNEDREPDSFAVFAELDSYDRPLIMLGLSFGRLINDVVVPYEDNKPFIVDGCSIEKNKLRRLKIVIEGKSFKRQFSQFNYELQHGSDRATRKIYGEQYYIRIEAILRDCCEDVTSQVISAFDGAIRPSLKEYMPKREELIGAAMRLFVESTKSLGSIW